MEFMDAKELLGLCGAGVIVHVGSDDPALEQALLLRGARAARLGGALAAAPAQADCVVAEAWWLECHDSLEAAFTTLRAMARRWVVVRFDDPARAARAEWENAAIASGLRRAPQAVSVDDYRNPAGAHHPPRLLAFECIPDEALQGWPFELLLRDRNLHMDMSRESGARADAHMVRYALAASLVRPGDTVLDCACGLGYGSAILAAQSGGANFIGIDIDEGTVAYARANFSAQYGVDYRAASATDLACIGDDTIDTLVSFETIEHLEDYEAFLREAKRVLKPDGRIIASVPHLWVDETGRDPNPWHFHAFDLARFHGALAAHFMVEERWSQTAPGGFKLLDAPRTLDRVDLDAPDHDTEWMILVASVDPLAKQASRPYAHPAFGSRPLPEGCWLADFGAHYDNPWLYRVMVQLGERVRDRALLVDLAARALGALPLESADFGAALTVLSYALLEQPHSAHVADALVLVQEYMGVDSANPHLRRWQISAAYAGARLALARGERELGRALFTAVEQADFLAFSPLLATKAVASSFQLGAMALADGDMAQARRCFGNGVAACRKALHADDLNAIGDPQAPLPFGFAELAEVADMGAQCASALALLPHYARSPGLFWQRVDARRFGVVSWAQAVERENRALRERLAG